MIVNNNSLDSNSQHVLNAINLIKSDISASGILPPDSIEFGQIIRFSDNGRSNKNGWYVAFQNPNGSVGAAFGNWQNIDEKRFYSSSGTTVSSEDRKVFSAQIQKAKKEAERERKAKQADAAKKANEIYSKSNHVDPDHAYLIKKKIDSYGLKQSGKALIIPVLKPDGAIQSLQQILPDGAKKFLPGGKIKGGSFVIGDIQQNDTFYICEGYATGASIYKADNKPVVIAFNSSNLKIVAQRYRATYPSKNIIIAADNDIETAKKKGKNPGCIAGEEAANAIGAELNLCPINSDFNDLQVKHGINAVQHALTKTRKAEKDIIVPLPLERKLDKAEPYPLYALGEIMGGAAKIMFKGIQAPDALCAHAVLGFATHAIQGHANIGVDGRVISLNEFYLSIGSRSSRKSECDSRAGQIHKTFQKTLLDQYHMDDKAFKDELDAYKKEKDKILNDKKKLLSDKNKAISKLRKHEPIPPHEPLILFGDPTIEGIHGLFINGTPSKYLCADEGGQVSGGHSMTSEKKTYTATTFSKWWDGAPIDRVRGGDGSSVLYGRRLSMHLMMQDKIAAEFFNDDVMRNQGLMSRFLIAYPESLTGQRHYQAYNVSESQEMKWFYDQIQEILEIPMPLQMDENTGLTTNELEPKIIYMEDDAKNVWVAAYEDIERESGKGCMFESIEGFSGKAANHIIRLAGIMALFNDINRKSIPKKYIDNAVVLMEYYLNERLRLTKMAEPNFELENAKILLKWIHNKGLKVVTLPDIYQNGPNRFRNKKQAQDTINILENHYWVTMIEGGGLSEISNKKSKDMWRANHAKI